MKSKTNVKQVEPVRVEVLVHKLALAERSEIFLSPKNGTVEAV